MCNLFFSINSGRVKGRVNYFHRISKLIVMLHFAVLMCFLLPVSCKKNTEPEKAAAQEVKNERVITDKILIILGEDYYTRTGILDYLQKEYGIGYYNAPIEVLPYSIFTANTKKPRLKLIAEKIEEQKSTVVISIGVPEGSGKYLIQQIKDNPELTVISLLPMEDILTLEAVSDIVIDFELPDELLNQEKEFKVSDDDVAVLLTAAVFAGEDINRKQKQFSPIEEFRQAFFDAEKAVNGANENKPYSIKPYIDPETSIASRKYLIIYEEASIEKASSDAQLPTAE